MIVQMKPAVAKVVNPLGTVVNVQSDDDNEIEPVEEGVIHENCDEALFRPFVTPKTVAYHNKVKRYGDDILTKSLEGTTEVTVKVLKKSAEKHKQKSREGSPTKPKNESVSKLSKHSSKNALNKKIGRSNDTKQNHNPAISSKSSKFKSSLVEIDPVDEIDSFSGCRGIVLDIPPPLENDDFFSLENITKTDTFEDAVDCDENAVKIDETSNRKEKDVDEIEDITPEDRVVAKKARKPKTKLGVKIMNVSTDANKAEKTFNECSDEITLPAPPRRSWSSIAASKTNEKTPSDISAKENDVEIAPIELVEEFTVTLPRKPCLTTSDLIDIDTPRDEKPMKSETAKDVFEGSGDGNLLKIDKSSDDEKGDTSGSQAEVTESDDSGKVRALSVFEDLTTSKTITMSKSSRKKKKRK